MKIVFTDRDGTLIKTPVDRRVDSPSKVELFPQTSEALRMLAEHGFSIIIITNQTGIAEGRFTVADYERINNRLAKLLAPSGVTLLKIYTCPHKREDGCSCRKPHPKLLLEAANEFGVDLSRAYMIGDRQDDIDLGRNDGVRTILVKTGTFPILDSGATAEVNDILEAVKYVVNH